MEYKLINNLNNISTYNIDDIIYLLGVLPWGDNSFTDSYFDRETTYEKSIKLYSKLLATIKQYDNLLKIIIEPIMFLKSNNNRELIQLKIRYDKFIKNYRERNGYNIILHKIDELFKIMSLINSIYSELEILISSRKYIKLCDVMKCDNSILILDIFITGQREILDNKTIFKLFSFMIEYGVQIRNIEMSYGNFINYLIVKNKFSKKLIIKYIKYLPSDNNFIILLNKYNDKNFLQYIFSGVCNKNKFDIKFINSILGELPEKIKNKLISSLSDLTKIMLYKSDIISYFINEYGLNLINSLRDINIYKIYINLEPDFSFIFPSNKIIKVNILFMTTISGTFKNLMMFTEGNEINLDDTNFICKFDLFKIFIDRLHLRKKRFCSGYMEIADYLDINLLKLPLYK